MTLSSSSKPSKIAIFSDIHGNLQALQAVLKEIDSLNVDYIICCGDVVGYGANPNECCEVLRERNIPTIAGNHDFAALGLIDISYFNDIARTAITWTRNCLTPENAEFLKSLPMSVPKEEMLFVHSSPYQPEMWHYVITMGNARTAFQHFTEKVCFIGHSHTPFIVENTNTNLTCPDNPLIKMKPESRYLVNVGSVGQPRDRNPDACYAIYDRAAGILEICRTDYDREGARNNIINAGLPKELAERLSYGL